MPDKIPADIFEELVNLLKEEARPAISSKTLRPIEHEFLNLDTAYITDLEEYISETEHRGAYRLIRLLEALSEHYRTPLRYIYRKPRFTSSGSSGHAGLNTADATALLIALEDLGFRVNPAPLVAKLAKKLSKKDLLTESELSIWCYEKQRYRAKIHLRSNIDTKMADWKHEHFKNSNGYRYELTRVDGRAFRLVVTGPKHRNLRPRQEMTCNYCGFYYTKGDLESSLSHRTEHARLKRILEPRPNRQFAQRLLRHKNPELVDEKSPFWMHQEVRERAVLFRREFRYDFLQWDGSRSKKAPSNAQGYLFTDHTGELPQGTIIGACAFSCRQMRWSLDWIWIIPSMRRRGTLLNRWPTFLERYGDFDIEHPLSGAMEAFVRRHGTEMQRSHLPPLF
jgi:hypothetical protein